MKIMTIRTNKNNSKLLVMGMFTLVAGFVATAQTTYEWPSFHGADRTNRSPETGLIKTWPAEGPELIQTISGIGEGYSSVAIAGGMIFTAGSVNQQPFVYAFDMKGKLLWKVDVVNQQSLNIKNVIVRGNYWAHPVVCNKKLYIRHDDKIFVYDIGA